MSRPPSRLWVESNVSRCTARWEVRNTPPGNSEPRSWPHRPGVTRANKSTEGGKDLLL